MSERRTTVITVRHGATAYGAEHRIAGRLDVPLSPDGARASWELRSPLSATGFDVVVSSPLVRAWDTARLATGLTDEQILLDPGCMERDYGGMQGLDPGEVAALDPPIRYVEVGGYHHSLNPPGGESFPELRSRAVEFVDGLLALHRGRSILVFSHQVFLQQVHGVLLGLDEIDCLAIDIGHLEVDRFTLDEADRLIDHTTDRTMEDADGSW